jgi:hypothetical protein
MSWVVGSVLQDVNGPSGSTHPNTSCPPLIRQLLFHFIYCQSTRIPLVFRAGTLHPAKALIDTLALSLSELVGLVLASAGFTDTRKGYFSIAGTAKPPALQRNTPPGHLSRNTPLGNFLHKWGGDDLACLRVLHPRNEPAREKRYLKSVPLPAQAFEWEET